jgi:hypothetical protein
MDINAALGKVPMCVPNVSNATITIETKIRCLPLLRKERKEREKGKGTRLILLVFPKKMNRDELRSISMITSVLKKK